MTAKPNPIVTIGKARFGNNLPLALIAGPCALESRAHAFDMAAALKDITARLGIGFVYKTSFDKANRTSAASARGLGLDKALSIFAELREKLGVPVLTDVHEPEQCAAVAEAVDILQIPAFLCRQTDLLVAAAKTGRVVNVKKGSFWRRGTWSMWCKKSPAPGIPTCWSPSAACRSATTRWSPTCARCRCWPRPARR